MGRISDMFASRFILPLICTIQTTVWCSPFPQNGTAQLSLGGSAPNGIFSTNNEASRPNAGLNTANSVSAGINSNPGASGAVGLRPQGNQGIQPGVQYEGNFPVPFTGSLFSSSLGLGSAAIHSKTQSASELMDGLSYGLKRVPSYVGYGVQSAGRIEKAGEQLFKAALDLGAGGVANGMQGFALGMNMMSGLGNAGMKGLGKVANASSQILEHILSLGVTESGLFNTLVALSRLMSPAQGSFLNSGLNITSLMNAANYLGIPNNNMNLNTIIDAAKRLQAGLSSAGISGNSINTDAIRQAASAAVQNLGLSTAWNILSSRLPGASTSALQAAVTSNTQLPVDTGNAAGVAGSGQGNAAMQAETAGSTGGNSWSNWFGF